MVTAAQKKQLQKLKQKFLRPDYSTSRAWNKVNRKKAIAKLTKSWNPPKAAKPKAKTTTPKPKKKEKPDYAGNIRNMYENSMASEASLTGNYYGQY